MTSNSPFESWPLPAYQLNSELEITAYSEAAQSAFGEAGSFLELLDAGSVEKAREFLQSPGTAGPVELNFISADGAVKLYDVHGKWNGDSVLNVMVVPKDERVSKVAAQLSELRSRLSDTNFDLLREKEQTEKLLQRVRELSAPTIQLEKGMLLIPFFGDLTADKIESIQPHVLLDVYEKDAQTVILDLTATDKISSEGMEYLSSILQSFQVMGMDTIITGVKPEHAKQLHLLESAADLRFEPSLAKVISGRVKEVGDRPPVKQ